MITAKQYENAIEIVKKYKIQIQGELNNINKVLPENIITQESRVNEYFSSAVTVGLYSVLYPEIDWRDIKRHEAINLKFNEFNGVYKCDLMRCRNFGKKSLLKLLGYLDQLNIKYY